MKTTTIRITKEDALRLYILKHELKAKDMSQVVSELINSYRSTHGWSAIALAEELTEMGKD